MLGFETERKFIAKVAAGDYKSCRRFVNEYLPVKQNVVLDLIVMLNNGDISKAEFKLKMQQLHAINTDNFNRFVNEFPKYWNQLSNQNRNEYIRKY